MAYGTSAAGLSKESAQALAQGLGWFSIGLGLAEVIAPGKLARALGMEGNETLIQAYGIREIATGVGIFSSNNPAPWLWGRVAGDALDVATLATGLAGDNPRKGSVGLAIAAVLGVTALDVICAQSLSQEAQAAARLPARDYSGRSGFPRGVTGARGAARDFEVPRDFRTPEMMRPYPEAG